MFLIKCSEIIIPPLQQTQEEYTSFKIQKSKQKIMNDEISFFNDYLNQNKEIHFKWSKGLNDESIRFSLHTNYQDSNSPTFYPGHYFVHLNADILSSLDISKEDVVFCSKNIQNYSNYKSDYKLKGYLIDSSTPEEKEQSIYFFKVKNQDLSDLKGKLKLAMKDKNKEIKKKQIKDLIIVVLIIVGIPSVIVFDHLAKKRIEKYYQKSKNK